MSDDSMNLEAELGQLVHKYQERGVDPNDISEKLAWYASLTRVRSDPTTDTIK